jgi:hypothetical protein
MECEILWLKILLKKLGFDSKDSVRLYCDNKAAINIAHNPVQHDQTKHVEIDRHFIKEKLREGTICTPYVKTGKTTCRYLDKGSSWRCPSFSLMQAGHARHLCLILRGSVEILILL